MPANVSIVVPQCPPGSPDDGLGYGRCLKNTFEEAKALCDADSECTGITRDSSRMPSGYANKYEPRNENKSFAGKPGASNVQSSFGNNRNS
jgi:hypothetical protein